MRTELITECAAMLTLVALISAPPAWLVFIATARRHPVAAVALGVIPVVMGAVVLWVQQGSLVEHLVLDSHAWVLGFALATWPTAVVVWFLLVLRQRATLLRRADGPYARGENGN